MVMMKRVIEEIQTYRKKLAKQFGLHFFQLFNELLIKIQVIICQFIKWLKYSTSYFFFFFIIFFIYIGNFNYFLSLFFPVLYLFLTNAKKKSSICFILKVNLLHRITNASEDIQEQKKERKKRFVISKLRKIYISMKSKSKFNCNTSSNNSFFMIIIYFEDTTKTYTRLAI